MRAILPLSLLICLLFATVEKAHATWLCVIPQARAINKKLYPLKMNDKVKHCLLTCAVSNKCNAYITMTLGVLKELIDLVGPGNAELSDIHANRIGAQLAYSGEAKNFGECSQTCKAYYQKLSIP